MIVSNRKSSNLVLSLHKRTIVVCFAERESCDNVGLFIDGVFDVRAVALCALRTQAVS